jgi:hypothetical protein
VSRFDKVNEAKGLNEQINWGLVMNKPDLCMISGFCPCVYEVFAYLGFSRISKERRYQTGTK